MHFVSKSSSKLRDENLGGEKLTLLIMFSFEAKQKRKFVIKSISRNQICVVK